MFMYYMGYVYPVVYLLLYVDFYLMITRPFTSHKGRNFYYVAIILFTYFFHTILFSYIFPDFTDKERLIYHSYLNLAVILLTTLFFLRI